MIRHLQLADTLDVFFDRLNYVMGNLDEEHVELIPDIEAVEASLREAQLGLNTALNAETRARAARGRAFKKVVKTLEALEADEAALLKKPAGKEHTPLFAQSSAAYARLNEEERHDQLPKLVKAAVDAKIPASMKESGQALKKAWDHYLTRNKAYGERSTVVDTARGRLSTAKQSALSKLNVVEGRLLDVCDGDRDEAESFLEDPKKGGKKGGSKGGPKEPPKDPNGAPPTGTDASGETK